ncbi:MAG: agmatine deiminase family protein [Bryobacteraceae bacterium]
MFSATPRELGYRMPAEWERHEATWLAWPHNPEDWPGKFQPIPWIYAEIVRLLSARERVYILANDEKAKQRAVSMLERAGAHLNRVTFLLWPTDRCWMRDSGPIFVRDGKGHVGVTNWFFNAWAKYENWRLDDQIPDRVSELLGLPAWQPEIELAGGLVLVPTFHDPKDRVALNILAGVFPERDVIGIHCVDLVWGLGTLHCMTQQQPADLCTTDDSLPVGTAVDL